MWCMRRGHSYPETLEITTVVTVVDNVEVNVAVTVVVTVVMIVVVMLLVTKILNVVRVVVTVVVKLFVTRVNTELVINSSNCRSNGGRRVNSFQVSISTIDLPRGYLFF